MFLFVLTTAACLAGEPLFTLALQAYTLKAKKEPVVITEEYEQWDEFTEKNVRA